MRNALSIDFYPFRAFILPRHSQTTAGRVLFVVNLSGGILSQLFSLRSLESFGIIPGSIHQQTGKRQ